MSQHVPETAAKCPRCQRSNVKKLDGQRAVCHSCSGFSHGVYYFCWVCRREWPKTTAEKGLACSLPNCALRAALLSDKLITNPNSSARGCPFFRACPKCNALLTHDGRGCPNIVCPRCCTEFCFRCLRQRCFGVLSLWGMQVREHHLEPCTIVDNSRSLTAADIPVS